METIKEKSDRLNSQRYVRGYEDGRAHAKSCESTGASSTYVPGLEKGTHYLRGWRDGVIVVLETKASNVELANEIAAGRAVGWKCSPTGMLCNPNPDGGIIDCALAVGTWFVIFNDSRKKIEDLPTREAAIMAFLEAV